MKKNYIKMNDNRNYLSLGNMFNIIKSISSNKISAMQSEIFCSLFDIEGINNTTVNNYCIGYRAIGVEYKKIIFDLKEKYNNDYNVFVKNIVSILSIMDEKIYLVNDESLNLINNNKNLKLLCNKLYDISKNDQHVSVEFINKVKAKISNSLYETIILFICYVVLENIQPIYIQDLKVNINKQELNEYLKVKLYEGISYVTSLTELAKKNNMYANAELASLEFDGLISGKPNYNRSYEYYLRASSKNHPKACWMVANLILSKKIGNIKIDFDIAWKYLNRAVDLGSCAAINTKGNCYLKGFTPNKEKDINKAKECYVEASELGYAYAYNNLGLIYEKEKNKQEALKCYTISADLGESWALNKVGEYYRKQGDLKKAYIYYLKSSESPINERNYFSFYNLAKFYYLKNKKTISKGIDYLIIASSHGVNKASTLLKKYINNI